MKKREETKEKIMKIIHQNDRKYPANDTVKAIKKFLDLYHEKFFKEFSDNGYRGIAEKIPSANFGWESSNAILFAATILTTIGYGQVTPKTEMGRFSVIVYSVLAVPLMTMFVTKVGDQFADLLSLAYNRLFCRFCNKRRNFSRTISKTHGRRNSGRKIVPIVTNSVERMYNTKELNMYQ